MADIGMADIGMAVVSDPALAALAFVASYLGCALLALRQKPHRVLICASAARLSPARAQRCAALGSVSLSLGLLLSLLAEGPSFGSILWVLSLAVAGFGVTFTLTYRPLWLAPLQRAFAPADPQG
jgi:hypothetical protein